MSTANTIFTIVIALIATVSIVLLIKGLRRRWQPKAGEGFRRKRRSKDVAARTAFLDNISLFSPLLPGLLTEHMDSAAWRSAVKAVGNSEFKAYSKKARGNARLWLRILNMWGIYPDRKSVIVASQELAGHYTDTSDKPLADGKRYVVKEPCWLLADSTATVLIRPGVAIEATASK